MATRIGNPTDEVMAEQVAEVEIGELSTRNPTVLSCGGIYIPRPRPLGAKDEFYKIINIANSQEPAKVVSGSIPMSILQTVLHKETMN